MDIPPEKLLETVIKIREFMKDHILPRLTEVECQLQDLRTVTWPVCQNIIEKSPLEKIEMKRKFLYHLDDEDAKNLLKLKHNISKVPAIISDREYQMIFGRGMSEGVGISRNCPSE